ncbi:MAG TPA: hypothetical protein VJN64_10745 [Terriglobales bacterium]|nr:hypothetical protein [Terriglobales bacterium]
MNLYRRRSFAASLLLVLAVLVIARSSAQRQKPHKLRATALLELTTSPKGIISSRLTPVVIMDDGRFYDASIYKARPRPMAAEIGVVYEAQKTGVPVGYVTITGAANNGGLWTAMGKWQSAQQVAKKEAPTPTPPNQEDDRPILHRGGDTSASSSTASPSPTPSPEASGTPEPEPEDPGRPVLRRRAPNAESTPTPESSPSPTPQPSVTPKPNAPAAGTQTMVAVSDNQPTDERSFLYQWKPGEEQEMDVKLRRLALAQLPPENAALEDNALQGVVIRSFDLDLTNEPVMILTAEIPGSYLTPGKKSAPSKFVSRYITLIARGDYEQNLQRLAVSITDSSRLDVAPRLELIDAVDVDGDGYGELLFREYGFDQKQFVVYGIGRGTVTKLFEGASGPLK